jgi:DNA-directed RNA polymerase specialized sigma24 family protein
MSDLLMELDRSWAIFTHSPQGRRTLAGWKRVEPTLGRFACLDELTEAGRDIHGEDLDGRDDIHLALLRLAATDQDARQAVLHLLHPALVNITRLYSDTWDVEEVSSLVITAALDRIVRYPQGLVRPAASIVRWVRRALWKEATRHRTRHRVLGRTSVLDDDTPVEASPERCAADELLELIVEAIRVGALAPDRARLVVLHRLLGVATADVAAAEGYPPSTIRQQRSRAESALAAVAVRRVA